MIRTLGNLKRLNFRNNRLGLYDNKILFIFELQVEPLWLNP